jgi:hypothetical protein
MTFQDAGATVSYAVGPQTTVNGRRRRVAAARSHARRRVAQVPFIRAGIVHGIERATVGANFQRSLVPSFGFGGSSSNQELSGYVRMPLASNRAYVQARSPGAAAIRSSRRPRAGHHLGADHRRLRRPARWLRPRASTPTPARTRLSPAVRSTGTVSASRPSGPTHEDPLMEERSVHPLDYLSVVRRRKWWFIVPLVICLLVGTALALFLPRTYYSHAEIGVAAASLSPELLKGVQSLDPAERQRAISQQLLSPAVLERVVREEAIRRSRTRSSSPPGFAAGSISSRGPIGRPDERGASTASRWATRTPHPSARSRSPTASRRCSSRRTPRPASAARRTRRSSSRSSSRRAKSAWPSSRTSCSGRRKPTWAGCRIRSARTCSW